MSSSVMQLPRMQNSEVKIQNPYYGMEDNLGSNVSGNTTNRVINDNNFNGSLSADDFGANRGQRGHQTIEITQVITNDYYV